MEKNKKHIDEFFREKLGTYREVPPADVWEGLDKQLDTLIPHVHVSPLKWLTHVGMVSLIGVLGVSLVQKVGSDHKDAPTVTRQTEVDRLQTQVEQQAVQPAVAAASTVALPNEAAEGVQDVAGAAPGTAASGQRIATANRTNGTSGTTVAAGKGGNGRKQILTRYKKPTILASNKIGPIQNIGAGNEEQLAANEELKTPLLASGSGTKANIAVAALVPNRGLLSKTYPQLKGEAERQHNQPYINRWELGVKGGYEAGFNKFAATKYVVSPYVKYKVSPRLSVMLQPAVKYAQSTERNVGKEQSYYRVNNDGSVQNMGTYQSTLAEGTTIITYFNTTYRYTQSHDSIVKVNKTGGKYMEYELPILLSYNVAGNLSVYGGPNLVLTQTQKVKEYTYVKSGIVRTIDTLVSAKGAEPTAPALTDVITYNGTPYSSYGGPLYPASTDSRVRIGAMIGVSYEYSDRWLLDAMVQKSPAGKNMQGGVNVNAPLSSTYFRLSVGYKLKK